MDITTAADTIKKLSADLDAGVEANIDAAAASLMDIAGPDLIPVIKQHMDINRIIKYGLDNHPSFSALLHKIMSTPS